MPALSRKDKLLLALLAAAVVFPIALLSNWGMVRLENMACRNAPSRWAASLQLKLAGIYGLTLRRQSQRNAYQRFVKSFPGHPRRGYAKYRIAVILDNDTDVTKDRTIQAYEDFLVEFENDPNSAEYVPEAERALRRLRGN